MQQFNATNLITGYIKQLLHDFNLPKCRIYTQEQAQYAQEHDHERYDVIASVVMSTEADFNNQVAYVPYIRNNHIQIYNQGEWKNIGSLNNAKTAHVHHYSLGQKILNYTKNLVIQNNIYDRYTHEYLGDYLRFKRDFEGINLMPLYNCFNNTLCPSLYQKIKAKYQSGDSTLTEIATFDSADTQYKIYMLPVKLFQKYTIAIDSQLPIEMYCGFYHHYLLESVTEESYLDDLAKATYTRIGSSQFNQPWVFDKLVSLFESQNDADDLNRSLHENLSRYARLEADLKLFIKLPVTNTSSITILEGDYATWNDQLERVHWKGLEIGYQRVLTDSLSISHNYSLINLEPLFNKTLSTEFKETNLTLISPLQLLKGNSGKQVAFADRLIEYLIQNVITDSADELKGNIVKVQTILKAHIEGLQNAMREKLQADPNMQSNYKSYHPASEIAWEPEFNKIIYEYLTTQRLTDKSINIDMLDSLGYMDKDVEAVLAVRLNKDKVLNMSTIEEDW